jgi:peptidoglycan/LPS O-acetylase OafA/YrhL
MGSTAVLASCASVAPNSLSENDYSMGRALSGTEANRLQGFGYLRAIAISLVLIQHQFMVLDLEHLATRFRLSGGQLGVSVFLAISGVLAAGEKRSPAKWLFARLKRVDPAFWLATLFSFEATLVSGYKKIGIYQLVS